MRKYLIILSAAILLLSCSSGPKEELKVISLNIRYDNPADAPNAWPDRKEYVLSFLKDEVPDIFGLQEALWHQYHYIDSCLPEYSSIGLGRSDGNKEGEMTPVFFRKDRFTVVNSGIFWLSETPDIPGSKGWGAVLPRIVTWLELKGNVNFFYFNTHYSHMSDSARLMSSGILLKEVERISAGKPFVITGDFNMLPDSKAYATLTEMGADDALIKDSFTISETAPAGVSYTFNGFQDVARQGRIDYIFVSSGSEVLSHETFKMIHDGLFISDHWPVQSLVILSDSEGSTP